MIKAKLISLSQPDHPETLAQIILEGGVVGAIWGHHLYFLAGNAFNKEAVKKINRMKGRPDNQVLASPGSVEEAEEFADLSECKGLVHAASKMGMKPRNYLEFLFGKFPLAVELYANSKAPNTVTFATKNGRTIWIAGHIGDKTYSKFLNTVREMRKSGKKIVFAGTSLNLAGENTLTVKQFEQVLKDFGDKIDAILVHPDGSSLKRLKYSTSSSGVSFITDKPKLLRVGCTPIMTLKKYIPDLQVPQDFPSTKKH